MMAETLWSGYQTDYITSENSVSPKRMFTVWQKCLIIFPCKDHAI